MQPKRKELDIYAPYSHIEQIWVRTLSNLQAHIYPAPKLLWGGTDGLAQAEITVCLAQVTKFA